MPEPASDAIDAFIGKWSESGGHERGAGQPFLIVCDVGHCFDLYAEFTGTGGQYEAFPDPRSRRIKLKDLHRQETRDLLGKGMAHATAEVNTTFWSYKSNGL